MCDEPRPHHFTRWLLTSSFDAEEARGRCFPGHTPAQAAGAIEAMSPRQLRALFAQVFGSPSTSNNTAWMRQKLRAALGLSAKKKGHGGASAHARRRFGVSATGHRGGGVHAASSPSSSPTASGACLPRNAATPVPTHSLSTHLSKSSTATGFAPPPPVAARSAAAGAAALLAAAADLERAGAAVPRGAPAGVPRVAVAPPRAPAGAAAGAAAVPAGICVPIALRPGTAASSSAAAQLDQQLAQLVATVSLAAPTPAAPSVAPAAGPPAGWEAAVAHFSAAVQEMLLLRLLAAVGQAAQP